MLRSFIVVAYDISDDKRRTRLHKRLKRYGLAAQYSVFECLLTAEQFEQMKTMVAENIKPKAGDRVRYYKLCEACRTRVEATDTIARQDAPALFA